MARGRHHKYDDADDGNEDADDDAAVLSGRLVDEKRGFAVLFCVAMPGSQHG